MHLMGRSRSAFWANVRMCLPVMFVSAFLNNTPVVSLMTPILVRPVTPLPAALLAAAPPPPTPLRRPPRPSIRDSHSRFVFPCVVVPDLLVPPDRCPSEEGPHPARVRLRAWRHLHAHRDLHEPRRELPAKPALLQERPRQRPVPYLRHRAVRDPVCDLGLHLDHLVRERRLNTYSRRRLCSRVLPPVLLQLPPRGLRRRLRRPAPPRPAPPQHRALAPPGQRLEVREGSARRAPRPAVLRGEGEARRRQWAPGQRGPRRGDPSARGEPHTVRVSRCALL